MDPKPNKTRENETLTEKIEKALEQSAAPEKATENKPATEAVVNRITSFTGEYLTNVKRVIQTPDPANPSRMIVSRKVLEGPTGLVLQAVVGHGKFQNTQEEYVTVLGQYGPGQTCRITVSAQNMPIAVTALLKDNVDKSSGIGPNGNIHWPLKTEKVVTAFGTIMRGRAILVSELYEQPGDGTTKVILGAPAEASKVADMAFL